VLDEIDYLAGIVTDRDLALRGYGRGLTGDVPVAEVMSRDLAVATPRTDVEDAIDILRSRAVRRLPVVDHGGRALGVVALDDLARHLSREVDALLVTPGVQAMRPPAAQADTS
jgi:CBS domain-containing protein